MRAHYERVLFASLPLDAKVTPEQVLDQRARIAKPPWPLVLAYCRQLLRQAHKWPNEWGCELDKCYKGFGEDHNLREQFFSVQFLLGQALAFFRQRPDSE